MTKSETAQQRFDRVYISSAEICRELGVTRPTVMQARKRRLLPDPVFVDDKAICVWERAAVKPFLDAWRIILTTRRNAEPATQ